jgi:hypothetical protein
LIRADRADEQGEEPTWVRMHDRLPAAAAGSVRREQWIFAIC